MSPQQLSWLIAHFWRDLTLGNRALDMFVCVFCFGSIKRWMRSCMNLNWPNNSFWANQLGSPTQQNWLFMTAGNRWKVKPHNNPLTGIWLMEFNILHQSFCRLANTQFHSLFPNHVFNELTVNNKRLLFCKISFRILNVIQSQ